MLVMAHKITVSSSWVRHITNNNVEKANIKQNIHGRCVISFKEFSQ